MWPFKSRTSPDTGSSRAVHSKQAEDSRLDLTTAWSPRTQSPGAQSPGGVLGTATSVPPTKGTVAGVGIIFKEVRARAPDGGLFVKTLVAGSSAQPSGMLRGDLLLDVDGVSMIGQKKPLVAAGAAILGPIGSEVRLTMLRFDARDGRRTTLSFSLLRALPASDAAELQVVLCATDAKRRKAATLVHAPGVLARREGHSHAGFSIGRR
ncbi:hypothetical protein T484DRAFT_1749527 [Baffinella frigidus]|nr:hypothetical protein T484DRAFT_1749527 [Cryptophyta sp. CCMP2293]